MLIPTTIKKCEGGMWKNWNSANGSQYFSKGKQETH